jgi:hypothetical protein
MTRFRASVSIRMAYCRSASVGVATTSVGLRQRRAVHEAGHAVAALAFRIPIVLVTIAAAVPHLHRADYRPNHDCGLECMVTLCLAGPEAEKEFCGSINDDSDAVDYEVACQYLAAAFAPWQVEAELVRYRDAAQHLVRSPFARQRIPTSPPYC